MGKRQIRIFENEFSEKLSSLLNQELNLVLKNNVTLHGKILNISEQKILLKDAILRKHIIEIKQIAEIVVDNIV